MASSVCTVKGSDGASDLAYPRTENVATPKPAATNASIIE